MTEASDFDITCGSIHFIYVQHKEFFNLGYLANYCLLLTGVGYSPELGINVISASP
jgi:hypothetical protein